MKVDTVLGFDPIKAVQGAKRNEEAGYAGVWTAEVSHDPFLPLVLASEHTERVELGTSIAVAFARSPMTTAVTAYDLQRYSKGRFILGLGSQIKPHIEKRFSMPWSHPAPRMREFILAMRAIWDCWANGTKLDFRGEFYTHTLMTPFFDPGPNEHGIPKVFLAAVGAGMTRVAGEVADGMLVHGFTTERYLREVTMPALEEGFAAGGRARRGFELAMPSFVVTGTDDESTERAAAAVRGQIAFYGSTPAYRGVLELHGWGELQDELNALSKSGQWEEMGRRIPDDVLEAFAIVAPPDRVAAELVARFGGVVDRVSFYAPYPTEPGFWDPTVKELSAA